MKVSARVFENPRFFYVFFRDAIKYAYNHRRGFGLIMVPAVSDIIRVLDNLAPPELAEDWELARQHKQLKSIEPLE